MEAYFGVALRASPGLASGGDSPDVRGAEPQQPPGEPVGCAGGLAGEAVSGLLMQAREAHQDDGRDRYGNDGERDGGADDDP